MIETAAPPLDPLARRPRDGGRPRPRLDASWRAPLARPEIDETDPLTGLHSRASLLRRLEQLLAAARRSGEPGALIFCDLAARDSIVARFGAAAGEAAERVAGHAIRTSVAGLDAAGRIAPGSFAVLLGRVAADQALAIAARLSTEVRSRRLEWDGVSLPVAVSVGITPFTGGEPAASLLAEAERTTSGRP